MVELTLSVKVIVNDEQEVSYELTHSNVITHDDAFHVLEGFVNEYRDQKNEAENG
jgi:hypothetical protein